MASKCVMRPRPFATTSRDIATQSGEVATLPPHFMPTWRHFAMMSPHFVTLYLPAVTVSSHSATLWGDTVLPRGDVVTLSLHFVAERRDVVTMSPHIATESPRVALALEMLLQRRATLWRFVLVSPFCCHTSSRYGRVSSHCLSMVEQDGGTSSQHFPVLRPSGAVLTDRALTWEYLSLVQGP